MTKRQLNILGNKNYLNKMFLEITWRYFERKDENPQKFTLLRQHNLSPNYKNLKVILLSL